MNRVLLWIGLLLFSSGVPVMADLSFPASFEVVEEEPNQFRITLTVPLVKGRYLKVQPIVPDGFLSDRPPETIAGAASLTQSWLVDAEREMLHNSFFGLDGLLGTSTEVRFLITTLDGRRFETVLRPTRSLFMVPEPEAAGTLAARSGRAGLRRAARSFGLWVVTASILLSGLSFRYRAGCLFAIIMGFVAYWAVSMEALPSGLSDRESGWMSFFHLAGCIAASLGIGSALGLLRSLLNKKCRERVLSVLLVLASAWGFYQGTGLLYRNHSVWLAWIDQQLTHLMHLWFSPFAADWAMARVRIPMLSTASLILFFTALVKMRYYRFRAAVAVFLLMVSFVLLPYGVAKTTVPFMSPRAPSPRQAQLIIGPMLSGIYHALNLEDEDLAYDRLAEQVSGNLAGDLYLDSRRRLISGTREGASVLVKQVDVQNAQSLSGTADRHRYRCRWTVTAKVVHWQHTHERRNLYEGDLALAAEDGVWKLAALNLLSEERKVVPGSFSSR